MNTYRGTARPFRYIGAAFIVESALFSVLAPLLPHFEHHFGLSTFGAGILASSYTATMIFGSLAAGLWTCRRFGIRATVFVGCAILGFATIGFGAAGTVTTLITARGLQGFGAGLIWCSLLNWLILVVPEESRGTAIGMTIGLAVFGSAAGPLLGAVAQAAGTFLVFATIAASVFVLAFLLGREAAPPQGEGEVAGSIWASLGLVRRRSLRTVTLVGPIAPIMGGAVVTLVPLQLSAMGADDLSINAVLLVGALAAAVCCVGAGRVADRAGNVRPIIGGILACVVSLLIMAVAKGVGELSVGYLIFSGPALAFYWVPVLNLFTIRGRELGMTAGASALLMNLAMTFGFAVGPAASTGIEQVTSTAVPYIALAVLGIPCAVFMYPLLRAERSRRRKASTAASG